MSRALAADLVVLDNRDTVLDSEVGEDVVRFRADTGASVEDEERDGCRCEVDDVSGGNSRYNAAQQGRLSSQTTRQPPTC